MDRIKTDILVAGGGVAGLSATAAFASAGFETLCVDPVAPVTDAAAEGSDLRSTAFLMPSVRLLEASGLWEGLADHAAPLRIMRIVDSGGEVAEARETADFVAEDLHEEVFGYNLPNWLLRREMTAHLEKMPRACLMAGTGVTHITPRTSAALVRLSDGRMVEARLVIAADGRNSALRDLLDIPARRWSYGQKAVVFTVSHPEPHRDVSTEIHRSGGPFTLVPLPDRNGRHHSAVVWMETGPEAIRLAELEKVGFEAELTARSCRVLGPLTLESPRRVWPIISQVAERLDGPRTALVAEAAHVVPPIGAQGLNMSLRDIATLLELCTDARDTGGDIGGPQLLSAYHRARHADILARVAGIDALNRAAMAQSQTLRDLRRAGLRTLYGLKPVRQTAMKMGLGVGR